MAAHRATVRCPRCDEALPAGLNRCDACGAYLVAAPGRASRPARASGGSGWTFLLVGLLAGGFIGYALRSSVGPRAEEEGPPRGPSDLMQGTLESVAEGVVPPGGSGMAAGGGMPGSPPGGMPPEVMAQLKHYREVLAKDPKDVAANIGLGNLHFDISQWQKAIDHYGRALEGEPRNADVRVDMAVAYHNLGQNDRAIQELKRVTRETPSHKNAWFNLGVVSSHVGDRSAAVSAWEQFLKLEPNSERATGIRTEIEHLKPGS